MKKENMKYVHIFLSATAVYILFIIRGLHNNHYLDWSQDFHIGDSLEIMIFTLPIVYFILKWFSVKQHYFKDALWLAFCTSVPFLVYDILYLGILKGYGFDYFGRFWFLTIFYFIVWIEIPIIGYLMQKDDPMVAKKHVVMLLVGIMGWLLNWWEGSHSDHYVNWSLNMKIVRLTNILLILLPIAYLVLRFQSTKEHYPRDAVLMALYLSSVFVLFDFLYLGIAKGHGLHFIQDYWFVTLFYPLFWIEIPLIGRVMRRS